MVRNKEVSFPQRRPHLATDLQSVQHRESRRTGPVARPLEARRQSGTDGTAIRAV